MPAGHSSCLSSQPSGTEILSLVGSSLSLGASLTLKTASWSEMPGIVSTLFISVAFVVKKSSKMLDVVSVILVGCVTI